MSREHPETPKPRTPPPDSAVPTPGPQALQPGFRDAVRALPPAAWALFAGTFINRFGSFVLVFLVLYLTDRGYSAPSAGLAVSLYGIGSVAATLVGGHMADRVGRRRTIALSMFSAAASLLALSQAEAYGLILLLSAASGFTAELYRPASTALLTDLTPAGRRVPAFALYRFAINLGMAMGPAVAGFLAERSFLLLFVGDALTCTLFGIVALVALPEGRTLTHEDVGRPGIVRAVVSDRPFLVFLVSAALLALVFMQAFATLPLHVRDSGLRASHYGMLMSFNGLLIVAAELAISSWTQRRSPGAVMVAGILATGVGFGLTALATSLPLLLLTVAVWTLGEMLYSPVAGAWVADAAPDHMRGRYQAAFGLTFGLGMVVAPTLGTMLYSASPPSLWALALVVALLAALLASVGIRRHDQ